MLLLLLLASSSGHSHQGQAHSRLSKRDSRLPISVKSANNDRAEPRPRDSDPNLRDMGHSNSGHVCHIPQIPSSPVYISYSRASSTGDRCSLTGLAGEVDVHVSTVSPAQQVIQKLRTTQEDEVILIVPWWPSQL